MKKLKLTHKITLFVILSIIAVSTIISIGTLRHISNSLQEQTIDAQNKSIMIASAIFERDLPGFSVSKTTEAAVRFELDKLPSFSDHNIIDAIGNITNETATLFLWDDETQDFWRKTTNIIKDDGARAVNTPLGQKGAVYPFLTKGENFTGQATILGKEYYTRYDPIFEKGTNKVVGILYVGIAKAQFARQKNEILFTLLLISTIAAFAIISIAAICIKNLLSKPLSKITEQMDQLAKGQKDFEIEGQDRQDEIGDMNRALAIFQQNAKEVERLEAKQQTTQEQANVEKRDTMHKIAQEFDDGIGHLIVSLSSASENLNTTAIEMRQIAEGTSQSSEEVALSSTQASSNVSTVAAAMEEMSASSSEVTSQMTTVKSKSDDTAQNAQIANEAVSELNIMAQDIGEVVAAVQGIAEQTNLLALNATIEAARAGDAGKGFAVVADEVKKLATETAQKTEEINQSIANIQAATQNSVGAMENIITSVSDIDNAITSVTSAINQQNATTNEVVRSISDATQDVNAVSQTIGVVQQGAQQTGQSANGVLGTANEVSDISTQLKDSVSAFLSQIRSNDA